MGERYFAVDHLMRRRVFLVVLVLLLITGSATGVHASTDCQRWFAAYKQQLAHSQAVKRLRAAKIRARRYAQMKLAGYVKPKPVVQPHRRYHPRYPRMTRAELLRRLDLACGVLPERDAEQPKIKEETLADFMPQHPVGVLPLLSSDDGQLIAENDPPQLPLFEESPTNYPNQEGYTGYTPPFFGGGGFPGFPGGLLPIRPAQPPTSSDQPPVVPAPVPEPESLVLLLTGIIGGAGVIRRKVKKSSH